MYDFGLDDAQVKKLHEWMTTLKKEYTGAIGGRFTFSFTPNSLGMVVIVKDQVTNEEIDISDYNW